MKKVLITIGLFALAVTAGAQQSNTVADDSPKIKLNIGVDLVSRYVWRGSLFSDAPNIQPYASVTYGQFTLMNWNSYAVNKNYAEVDFFLTWQPGRFGITLSDFCGLVEPKDSVYNYFDYNNKTTSHAFESTVFYTISESFPLKLTAGVFFYGLDKNEEGDNNYSTYYEVSYPLQVTDYNLNFFAGGTTDAGYYGTKAGLVNVGTTIQKELKVTPSFTIPLSLSLSANPVNKYAYAVIMISF